MTDRMRGLLLCLGGGALALTLAGCTPDEAPDDEYTAPPIAESSYLEGGDLSAIEERRRLRLLVPEARLDEIRDAASEHPIHRQVRYAADFAESLELRPVLVPVDNPRDLVAAVNQGKGDLIVANLPRGAFDNEPVALAVPIDRSRRELIAKGEDPIADMSDLAGRTLAVPADSYLWRAGRDLQRQYPELQLQGVSRLDPLAHLERLRDGEIELTLAESNSLDAALDEDGALRAVFPASEETGISWAMRPQASALQNAINRYISQRELARDERDRRTGDLAEIRETRTLRVATRTSAANYFVWRGQLLGFEYELAQALAKSLDLRLEVVAADAEESLLDLVREGRADIAAAFLTPLAAQDTQGIAWSRFYHRARQVVVGQPEGQPVDQPGDLDGRTLHVPAQSHYVRTLELLKESSDLEFTIERLPRGQTAERTLQSVAAGDYDLTVVDDHLLRNARLWVDGLQRKFVFGQRDNIEHHWAVRADNAQLLATVNDFLANEYRGLTYNTLYSRYFEADSNPSFATRQQDIGDGRQLSPWDETIRKYAEEHGFDWRLLVAQIYQESRFNPQAQSWVGARGLMQIMPRTARQLGVAGDLTDPETSIEAGVRYMAWLRERFEEDLPVLDRMWFTLAAYNAGVSHVRAARRLADQLGYDRDRWFDNVERAMVKLSQREYYQRVGSGYVRGQEPVTYVRNIRERYRAYLLWTEDCWPDCSDNPHTTTVDIQRGPGDILTRFDEQSTDNEESPAK